MNSVLLPSLSGRTYTLKLNKVTFTASGGSIAPVVEDGFIASVAYFVQTVAVAGAAGSAGVGALRQMLTTAKKALIHDD